MVEIYSLNENIIYVSQKSSFPTTESHMFKRINNLDVSDIMAA